MANVPKPRPLTPQESSDATRRMVDRMVTEGVRPTFKPAGVPKPRAPKPA